jgi:hypothetical protein
VGVALVGLVFAADVVDSFQSNGCVAGGREAVAFLISFCVCNHAA